MSDAATTFVVLGAAVLLFVWNRLPVEITAIGVALSLYAAGVLDLPQVLAGFGDPVIIFIATLFVVAEGLDASGVTTWAGQQLNAHTGESRTHTIVLAMLLVALVTAAISLNGAVAALLPLVIVMALRHGPPSQVLLPFVFAAHAGSLLTLTGTPVNLLVSEVATNAGLPRFGYFEFAVVGVPLLLGTVVIVILFGDRLLPRRTPRSLPRQFDAHATAIVREYSLANGAMRMTSHERAAERLFTYERGVVEVFIPPRSDVIGEPVFPGMATTDGELVVLAIRRGSRHVDGETTIAAGDALLLEGPWEALNRRAGDPDLLVVHAPDAVRRRVAPIGSRATIAAGVLAAMVTGLVLGRLPEAVVGLLAASAMVLLRVITMEQAYRAISWTTIILVAAMMPLATAMRESGAAEMLAGTLVSAVGGAGPLALLAGLFLLTAALGQVISNMATALVVSPIAMSAAAGLGVSPRPLLMTVAVAAAAAFLTPVSTPVNLMVREPGGYHFGDYWRLGLPLLIWFFIVSLVVIPLVWPFRPR